MDATRRIVALLAVLIVVVWCSPAQGQSGTAPSGGAPTTPAQPTTKARTRYAPPTAQPTPGTQRGAAGAPRTATTQQGRPQGNVAAQQGNPQAGGAGAMPLVPFQLTPAQQQLIDQILTKWERESDNIKTYVCHFTRWEIDPTFGPKENHFTRTEAKGAIKYKAPDRGEYYVDSAIHWDQQQTAYVNDDDARERWMCDGEAIYEWNRKNRQLIVRTLPQQLQGKAIADGPLPFVFGAKAEQLKKRYWLRDITPKNDVGKKIWLEARPKFQKDAANFQRAKVVLDEKTFLPVALQLFPPGVAPDGDKVQAYTAFSFESPSVNNPLDQLKFLPPITPPLWKRVMVDDPAVQPNQPAPQNRPAQAQRPAAAGPRTN